MKMTIPSIFNLGIPLLCIFTLNCTNETTLPQNNKSLANTQWRMNAYEDINHTLTYIDFKKKSRGEGWYRLVFDSIGRAGGFDNCNGYSGVYSVKNGSLLKFDSIWSTSVYCPNSLDFLNALDHSNYYDFPHSSLSIITTLPDLHKLYFVVDTVM